jgi:hypothetical protein
MEACREGRQRGGADDDGRQGQESVGLDDHRVAAASLYVTTLPRQRDRVDVTTDHAAPPSG